MKDFKFFGKRFNPRQYDIGGWTFIGVSPFIINEYDGTRYRRMIYMCNINQTPITSNIIYENEEPYHQADIIEIRGNQIFQRPRTSVDYITVTLTFTPNERL
jgi:hypothetical protein